MSGRTVGTPWPPKTDLINRTLMIMQSLAYRNNIQLSTLLCAMSGMFEESHLPPVPKETLPTPETIELCANNMGRMGDFMCEHAHSMTGWFPPGSTPSERLDTAFRSTGLAAFDTVKAADVALAVEQGYVYWTPLSVLNVDLAAIKWLGKGVSVGMRAFGPHRREPARYAILLAAVKSRRQLNAFAYMLDTFAARITIEEWILMLLGCASDSMRNEIVAPLLAERAIFTNPFWTRDERDRRHTHWIDTDGQVQRESPLLPSSPQGAVDVGGAEQPAPTNKRKTRSETVDVTTSGSQVQWKSDSAKIDAILAFREPSKARGTNGDQRDDSEDESAAHENGDDTNKPASEFSESESDNSEHRTTSKDKRGRWEGYRDDGDGFVVIDADDDNEEKRKKATTEKAVDELDDEERDDDDDDDDDDNGETDSEWTGTEKKHAAEESESKADEDDDVDDKASEAVKDDALPPVDGAVDEPVGDLDLKARLSARRHATVVRGSATSISKLLPREFSIIHLPYWYDFSEGVGERDTLQLDAAQCEAYQYWLNTAPAAWHASKFFQQTTEVLEGVISQIGLGADLRHLWLLAHLAVCQRMQMVTNIRGAHEARRVTDNKCCLCRQNRCISTTALIRCDYADSVFETQARDADLKPAMWAGAWCAERLLRVCRTLFLMVQAHRKWRFFGDRVPLVTIENCIREAVEVSKLSRRAPTNDWTEYVGPCNGSATGWVKWSCPQCVGGECTVDKAGRITHE